MPSPNLMFQFPVLVVRFNTEFMHRVCNSHFLPPYTVQTKVLDSYIKDVPTTLNPPLMVVRVKHISCQSTCVSKTFFYLFHYKEGQY